MIIIGLEGCGACKELKEKHPDVRYVEIPKTSGISLGSVREAKMLLGRNKIKYVPVLCDDEFKTVLSIKDFDSDFHLTHQYLR